MRACEPPLGKQRESPGRETAVVSRISESTATRGGTRYAGCFKTSCHLPPANLKHRPVLYRPAGRCVDGDRHCLAAWAGERAAEHLPHAIRQQEDVQAVLLDKLTRGRSRATARSSSRSTSGDAHGVAVARARTCRDGKQRECERQERDRGGQKLSNSHEPAELTRMRETVLTHVSPFTVFSGARAR